MKPGDRVVSTNPGHERPWKGTVSSRPFFPETARYVVWDRESNLPGSFLVYAHQMRPLTPIEILVEELMEVLAEAHDD